MWFYEILGTDVYHIVHWFFVYSILGWIVESIYMSICNKKLTNRGFIRGPMCPIYGAGALSVYFILKPFAGDYILLFFLGTMVATAIEYITALLMLRIFGEVWWDYQNKPLNFRGILCLESSIAWGVYTVGLFAFLQNFVMAVVDSYAVEDGMLLGSLVLVYFTADFLYSLYRAKEEAIMGSVRDLREQMRAFWG